MTEFWPLQRLYSQPQALHFSYEKAGLTIADQPVPWNAEAVLVEVLVKMSQNYRVKTDFSARVSGLGPVSAESLRAIDDQPDRFRVLYRLPPLTASASVEVRWRERMLGQLTIPFLPRAEFIESLRLQMPMTFARLGDETVACQTFVSNQCKGLFITALLTSPTCLAPLMDLDLQVEVQNERGGPPHRFPVRLSSSQLNGRQALLTVVPRKLPRRTGVWAVNWLLGDHCLATQRVRAVSTAAFHKSLRVSDTRFLIEAEDGALALSRQLPGTKVSQRVGPCFLVSSREPGMAGLCRLSVRAQVPDSSQAPRLLEQDVLITDGPTMVAPGTIEASQLNELQGFDLCLKNKVLCTLPLNPAPVASFNAEGAFDAVNDYQWSVLADDELAERLSHLTGPGGKTN